LAISSRFDRLFGCCVHRHDVVAIDLLTVYGQWQRQGEGEGAVMHLLAARLIDHTPLLQGLVSRSRDFR